MSRGKTGLIVLTFLAAFFFLFIAVLFGSSTKRQAAIDRVSDLNAKLDSIAENDITIYWIGEPPKELEHLLPVITVIPAESASKDNLPIKGPSFHTIEYNPNGEIIQEQRNNASEWESKTNGCVEYWCDNSSGFVNRSKCISTNTTISTCINDECVNETICDETKLEENECYLL